jgi:hypothetical protein
MNVLQQKLDASFRWHDGENWEVISTDRPPLLLYCLQWALVSLLASQW